MSEMRSPLDNAIDDTARVLAGAIRCPLRYGRQSGHVWNRAAPTGTTRG